MQALRVTTDLRVPQPPSPRQPARSRRDKWRCPAGHRRTRWEPSARRRKKYLSNSQTLNKN